ncbi:MAG: SpoIID/LytB domain-containing protein [Ruminiclostridium sp.]|nr:SpoIID/LytB domain-containing protein [Ruminiclostridium sp.]
MQNIDSIELSMDTDTPAPEEHAAPAVTSGVNEEGMAVYTYATELNVVNARKPRLADYTHTQALLLVPSEDETTTPAVTTVPADFIMSGDDLDYTVPKTTTPAATTPPADTTASPAPAETSSEPVTASVPETSAPAPAQAETPASAEYADDNDDLVDIEDQDDEPDDTEAPEDDIPVGNATVVSPDDTTLSSSEEVTVSEDTSEAQTEPPPPPETSAPPVMNVDAANEMLTVNAAGTIVTDTALNVVSAAVMAEISDVFDPEAIKAQAVATYTYIKYYNDNNQRAYIAKSKPSKKVTELVQQVLGQLLYYKGTMIQAVYSASTAGRTASSKNVWGIDYPYLQSIDTGFIDKEYDINYGRKVEFTSDEIRDFVRKSTGIELSGDPSEWIKIESYNDEVFVGQMSIGGHQTYNNGTRNVKITGRVFRETILDYNIRSSSFDIRYDPDTDKFLITTYGYGHCVGFSQHGANILASKYGYTYDQILKFYYPGVDII